MNIAFKTLIPINFENTQIHNLIRKENTFFSGTEFSITSAFGVSSERTISSNCRITNEKIDLFVTI